MRTVICVSILMVLILFASPFSNSHDIKKRSLSGSVFYKNSGELFYRIEYCFEGLRIVHGEIGEHLAVQIDV